MLDRNIMLKALRWLAQNPENHIKNVLAATSPHLDDDDYIYTLAPEATCWCALGRYAVEANMNIRLLDEVEFNADDDKTRFSTVWETNDYYVGWDRKTKALIEVGKLFDITEEEIFNA